MKLARAQEVVLVLDAERRIEAVCLPCHGGHRPSLVHFYQANRLLPEGLSCGVLSRRWDAWVIATDAFACLHQRAGTVAIPRGITIFFPREVRDA